MNPPSDKPNSNQVAYMQVHEGTRSSIIAQIDFLIEQSRADFEVTLNDALTSDADFKTPPADLFRAIALQSLFCRMCGADPATLIGGNASDAAPIIQNLNGLVSAWE